MENSGLEGGEAIILAPNSPLYEKEVPDQPRQVEMVYTAKDR